VAYVVQKSGGDEFVRRSRAARDGGTLQGVFERGDFFAVGLVAFGEVEL
jgi:hypothetical protein